MLDLSQVTAFSTTFTVILSGVEQFFATQNVQINALDLVSV